MYQLNIKLKQHTPLIHFQDWQDGATLRATEVKPKLDRYLIENEFGGILNFDEYKQYLVGDVASLEKEWKKKETDNEKLKWLQNQKMAFDYKLSIAPSKHTSYYLPLSLKPNNRRFPNLVNYLNSRTGLNSTILAPSPYFANSDKIKYNGNFVNEQDTKINEVRFAVLSNDNIVVKFNSNFYMLISAIEKHLSTFFVSTTFGNRNSKGFGCFSLANQSLNDIKETLLLTNGFAGIFEKTKQGDLDGKFKFIAEQYGKLKRGVSERKDRNGRIVSHYQKSSIWEYICNNRPVNWEKKKIKTFLKENHQNEFNQLRVTSLPHRIDTCNAADDNSFKYVRAILGLAEHFEFVKQRGRLKVIISDTMSHRDETKHLAVERFKSPLQYYVFDDTIFLLTKKIPKEFIYVQNGNQKQVRQFRFTFIDIRQPNYFEIPVPEIFDLSDFIDTQTDFIKIK